MGDSVSSKQKLLIIGVDAGSPELFRRWSADGDMPNLNRLMRGGISHSVQNPYCLEAGSVWPVFQSGLLPGHQPQYDGRRTFDATTYSSRWFGSDETTPTLWRQLSDNGIHCLLIDPPYTHLDKEILGTMVVDWSGHVPANGCSFEFAAHPPAIADEVLRVIGKAPDGNIMCDRRNPETVSEYREFRDVYLQRIALKGKLAKHLMQSTIWDVAFIVSSDLHCTGHHLWHINDPQHPEYSSDLEAALGEPIRDCYRAFDLSLGEILDDLSADTTVLLFGSHGMGPSYSGTGLLDRVLQRLDEAPPAPARFSALAKSWLRALWLSVPRQLRGQLKPLRRPFRGTLRPDVFVADRQDRRFFEVYANNATGGIRLNTRGRESNGCIDPEETGALMSYLTTELKAVVNVDTGEPLVADVIVTRDWYKGPYLAELPDMLVRWNRSAPITQVQSATIGKLSHHYSDNRTGDHTPEGLCVVWTPASGAPGEAMSIRAEDFAPSIATFFGIDLGVFDGQPFPLKAKQREDAQR